MSIEPATAAADKREWLLLDQLPVAAEHTYIFDFDGVVSSSLEDCIYKLPATEDELPLINEAARFFGIRCGSQEQSYQRHLIYQAAALRLGLPVEPGPAFEKFTAIAKIAPLFVLTARSGWFAVERLRAFLALNNIQPVEVFNVGRVSKSSQIELVRGEYEHSRVFFIDDSENHLKTARKAPNLELVWANGLYQYDPIALRLYFEKKVRSALSN